MSFELLVKKLSPKLKIIAHKLNGRYTTFSDEDLFQEALINLWFKYQSGQTIDKKESYLIQGAYFQMKNFIRKSYKAVDRNSVSLNNYFDKNGRTFEEYFYSEKSHEAFDRIEEKIVLENKKNILNQRERRVLDLAIQGLATRMIGEKIEASHVTVVKIMKKIKIKIACYQTD
jgi:RNA polymerase sigma factor (sigma-70 family)